jgi:hypothetical protein
MERRSFLKGLLIGVPAAGTALVQLASPAEAALLKVGEETALAQLGPPPIAGVGGDLWWRDKDGSWLEIGEVLDIEMPNEPRAEFDITMGADQEKTFVRGLKANGMRVTMSILPSVKWLTR